MRFAEARGEIRGKDCTRCHDPLSHEENRHSTPPKQQLNRNSCQKSKHNPQFLVSQRREGACFQHDVMCMSEHTTRLSSKGLQVLVTCGHADEYTWSCSLRYHQLVNVKKLHAQLQILQNMSRKKKRWLPERKPSLYRTSSAISCQESP